MSGAPRVGRHWVAVSHTSPRNPGLALFGLWHAKCPAPCRKGTLCMSAAGGDADPKEEELPGSECVDTYITCMHASLDIYIYMYIHIAFISAFVFFRHNSETCG